MEQAVTGDVWVALCETHPALRGGLQTALYRLGLRNIEVCKDSTSLIWLMQTRIVDLVICATDLPGIDFRDLVQQIRHGTIGRNPFALVVATMSEPTLDDVRQAMNAGVDRVAIKPMSMADIVGCVNALAQGRKPFVATNSYVGPTRRGPSRVGGGDEAMPAPNTLQARLAGTSEYKLETMISSGRAAVDTLRLQTSCLAVARSGHRVATHFTKRLDGPIGKELSRLRTMSRALGDNHRNSVQYHLAEIASSLVLLADLLDDFPPAQMRMLPVAVELLKKLSEAVRLAGLGDPNVTETVHAIAITVRTFAANLGVSGANFDGRAVVDGAPDLLNS